MKNTKQNLLLDLHVYLFDLHLGKIVEVFIYLFSIQWEESKG